MSLLRPFTAQNRARGAASLAILLLGLFCGIAGSALASESEESLLTTKISFLGFADAPQPVDVKLIIEHSVLTPEVATRIGVLFAIEEGWHIYAEDPGDAGIPTRVEWLLPEGFSAGPLLWPPHEDFLDPGDIRTFAYSDSVLLSSTLQATPQALQQDNPEIHAAVTWLACKEICIPGEVTLSLSVGTAEDAQRSEDAAVFEAMGG